MLTSVKTIYPNVFKAFAYGYVDNDPCHDSVGKYIFIYIDSIHPVSMTKVRMFKFEINGSHVRYYPKNIPQHFIEGIHSKHGITV